MIHKSVKNALLLGMAAALLNYSFAIAQPANPPSSGALTPNFTGLNVSGDTTVGGNLKTDYITTQDPTATEVIFGTDIFTEQNLTVSDDTTTTSLYTRNISPLVNEKDINVLGNLKTDSIGEKTTGNGTRFSNGIIVNGQVAGQTFGGGSALFGSLETSVDAVIGGSLKTNNIKSTNGTLTNFDDNVNMDNDLTVGADISASYINLTSESIGLNAEGDIEVGGNIFIGGSPIMEYIGSKFYPRSGVASTSSWRSVSCLSGDILINCGAYSTSNSTIKRIYTYGSSGVDSTCAVQFTDSGSGQMADAICLDL